MGKQKRTEKGASKTGSTLKYFRLPFLYSEISHGAALKDGG